jgi:hypothetical protein
MESGGSNEHLIKLINLVQKMLDEGLRYDTVEEALRNR